MHPNDAAIVKVTAEQIERHLVKLDFWRAVYLDRFELVELRRTGGPLNALLPPIMVVPDDRELSATSVYIWVCKTCASLTLNPEVHQDFHDKAIR